MIFGAKIKKKQDVKSVFDKAWEITSSWEGDYKSGGGGAGNKFNGIDYGTQYGIIATFARNFGGIALTHKDVIRNLNIDKCKELWKKVLWDKMILGDKIKNEKVAMLLFDICVHLQSHLNEIAVRDEHGEGPVQYWTRGFIIIFLCNESDESIDLNDWTGFTTRVLVNKHFNVKLGSPTDKASILTQKAIDLINQKCNLDARGFFDRLNAARKIAESKWEAQRRMNAFTYDKITPNTVVRKFYDDAITNRKILFFTQKGCVPCLQLKPTCEALARQNDFSFQEVDIRTESGKILMTQYRVGATPEVVLIEGNLTKQWGAADLFDDKLALYLNPPIKTVEPDPFDDGKPIVTPAPASSNGTVFIPLVHEALNN